jgi:hypothetical protein
MTSPRDYQKIPNQEDELQRLTSSEVDYETEKLSRVEQSTGWRRSVKVPLPWVLGHFGLTAIAIILALLRLPWQCTPRDMLNYCTICASPL